MENIVNLYILLTYIIKGNIMQHNSGEFCLFYINMTEKTTALQ